MIPVVTADLAVQRLGPAGYRRRAIRATGNRNGDLAGVRWHRGLMVRTPDNGIQSEVDNEVRSNVQTGDFACGFEYALHVFLGVVRSDPPLAD